MIEVSVEVLRGPVFLAGETVEAEITFTCRGTALNGLPEHGEECLALGTVQIHCVRIFLQDRKRDPRGTSNSVGTSFHPLRGEKGEVVLQTSPKILFCDLKFAPGEVKTYSYVEPLPFTIPPSYRGHAVKHCYKLIVGTQRLGQPIKVIRLPLKVLTLPASITREVQGAHEAGSDSVAPANPFLEASVSKGSSSLEAALQILQNVTARRCPSIYVITHTRGRVAQFCLYKNCYKLGEDIVGTFDFRNSEQVPCIQFLVTLQSLELVRGQEAERPSVMSHHNFHEDCMHKDSCHVVLPIPLHVTPSFKSETVNLSWRLHFEFVLSSSPYVPFDPPSTDDLTSGALWEAPPLLDIETMIWDLPITLVPSSPLNVAQGLQLEPQSSLIL